MSSSVQLCFLNPVSGVVHYILLFPHWPAWIVMISLKTRFGYAGLTIEEEELPWHSRAALLCCHRLILTTCRAPTSCFACTWLWIARNTRDERFRASATQRFYSIDSSFESPEIVLNSWNCVRLRSLHESYNILMPLTPSYRQVQMIRPNQRIYRLNLEVLSKKLSFLVASPSL